MINGESDTSGDRRDTWTVPAKVITGNGERTGSTARADLRVVSATGATTEQTSQAPGALRPDVQVAGIQGQQEKHPGKPGIATEATVYRLPRMGGTPGAVESPRIGGAQRPDQPRAVGQARPDAQAGSAPRPQRARRAA